MYSSPLSTMRGQGVLHSAPSPVSLSCTSRPRHTQRCTQSSRAALDDFGTQQHGQRQGLAGPARVFAPAAESRDATGSHDTSGSSVDLALEERATDAQPAGLPSWPSPVSIQEVTAPVAADRDIMNQNLVNIGERRNPQLQAAAKQIFGAGGKRLRPVIVFLVGRATIQLSGLRCGIGPPAHVDHPVTSVACTFTPNTRAALWETLMPLPCTASRTACRGLLLLFLSCAASLLQ